VKDKTRLGGGENERYAYVTRKSIAFVSAHLFYLSSTDLPSANGN
jgi:hypothetical protein